MEDPQEHSEFEKVWNIREKHMVKDVPSQYVFFSSLCYDPVCPHPICVKGRPVSEPKWFENRLPLLYLPFSGPDVAKSWESETCQSCTVFCCGCYLKPEDAIH